MRRWVTTWYAWLLAATCLGRGVPTYREYSRPVIFGHAASAASAERAIDEERRLERLAAAARADIVGEETALDLIAGRDSPFAERGISGAGLAALAASGRDEEDADDRKNKREAWLADSLQLESMTSTNRAVLQGMGLDEGGASGRNWLYEETRRDGDAQRDGDSGEDGETDWDQAWEDAMTGGGSPDAGVADALRPETAGGASGSMERAPGPMPPGAGQGAGMENGGAELELARVKEVLAQIDGGGLSALTGEGRAGLSAGGMVGGSGTGVSADGLTPDWDTLLRGGSVKDLIAANGGGTGGDALAGFGGDIPAGRASVVPSENGWNAARAWSPEPRSAVPGGGWGADAGLGGSWGGIGRSGGWSAVGDRGAMDARWGGGDTGGAFGVPSWSPAGQGTGQGTGGSRYGDWTKSRPAGGGFRPAWD